MPYQSSSQSDAAAPDPSRVAMTVPRFMQSKSQGRKLSMLTAYDHLWAGILDAAGVDSILVGDSLGMVVQGKSTTVPVRVSEMIYHAEMVVRAVRYALVIVDLPFLSFHVSPRQAVRNAGEILKRTGAAAVKLEGGRTQARTIAALADADIPVMAHVGLRPQSVHKMGGYKVQREVDQLLDDSLAAQASGAFSVLLECVPISAAARITAELKVPTIGIGAGNQCDGQVLVTPDMLGLTPGPAAKFVKQFAELRTAVTTAVQSYVSEVQAGHYPDGEHSYR